MADSFELTLDLDAAPDAVWDLVGDPCGVTRWYPVYVDCRVEGDVRTLRRADGSELVEHMLERDDAERRYAYSVVAGAPVHDHRASFQVLARPDGGSTVVWRTSGRTDDPSTDIEARLAARQAQALEGMRALFPQA
ncbi:MAG: SRPBCC family protein [Thermoleophilia bacterium]